MDTQVNSNAMRVIGEKVTTTCLRVGEFDLLAVNLFAFENDWQFAFAKNWDLPRTRYKKYLSEVQAHLLASTMTITLPMNPPFFDEPFHLLDEIVREKTAKGQDFPNK